MGSAGRDPGSRTQYLARDFGRHRGPPEKRIAVQEYGRPSQEFIDGLMARGADSDSRSGLPVGPAGRLGPLREAARRLAAGEIDVLLITSSAQIEHLLRVAAEMDLEEAVRDGLRSAL